MVPQQNRNPNDRLPMRTPQEKPDEEFGSWVSQGSRGFQIMSNMGYSWGQPLGFSSRGITNPIEAPNGRLDTSGLGEEYERIEQSRQHYPGYLIYIFIIILTKIERYWQPRFIIWSNCIDIRIE